MYRVVGGVEKLRNAFEVEVPQLARAPLQNLWINHSDCIGRL